MHPTLRLLLFSSASLCLTAASPLSAQVLYSTPGADYVQNFDAGLPAASNNSVAWTNNTMSGFPGWHIQRELTGTPATYRINSLSASGGVQHFRISTSATDGALGARPNDTSGKIHYALRLRNNTGVALRSFALEYALEQWHRSGTNNANALTVSFKLGDPPDLGDDGMWALITPLTLLAPQSGGTASDLNGADAANRVASPRIMVGGFEWAPGTDLWIRFTDDNDGGVDQGLALDDLVFSAATTAEVPVGGVVFGRNGYAEYQPGDCPVIVVSGHGGREVPAEIPDRTYGAVVEDKNTQDLARKVADEIFTRTGRRPHLVINRLHRVKMDPNREIVEAAQGDPEAETAWSEFHGFITDARLSIEPQFGFGFLIDLHGHAHAIPRLELGYVLEAADLNKSDAELSRPCYAENSTVRSMTYRPGVDFPALIRGPRSLGDLFEQRNYASVPSPTNPGPGTADYFEGGYNVSEHGSLQDIGNIHAVQIEAQFDGVRDTDANRATFAGAIAETLHDFLYDQWGYVLGTGSLFTLEASGDSLNESGGTVTLTITRSGHIPSADTMALHFDGTAVPGTDYTASATSVSFAPFETEKTVVLTAVDNALVEGAKSIVAGLAPTAAQTADVLPLKIALADDELPSVHITPRAETLDEGGLAVQVDVIRDAVAGALQAQLRFGGTARRDVDYTVTGLDALDRVVFTHGSGTHTISLAPINNSAMDPAKTIVITVQPGSGHAVGVPGAATVVLEDDDLDPALELWFANRIEEGAWRDESRRGREGALRPYGTSGAAGPIASEGVGGTALEFDGVNDAVVTPYFPLGGGEFTLSFRFRLDATGTTNAFRHLFNIGAYDTAHSLTIHRIESNNSLRTLMHDANEAPSNSALDVANIAADGTWRHYALTASGSGGLRVFVDGVQVKSVGTWSGNFDPRAALWLGWRGEYSLISSRHLDGAMEDVRIYSRALSATEVATLSAIPPKPPAAPLALTAAATSWNEIALAWSDQASNESGFKIERSLDGVSFSLVATVGADVTSYADLSVAPETGYYYRVRATNADGDSVASNPALAVTQAEPVAVSFSSIAAHDGWVLESGENTDVGGQAETSALRAGDNSQNRQYRTIVSFDTAAIPDGAVILSATLKLRRSGVSGTNPFTTHGDCQVDIKGGSGFGGALALATGDFQAAADAAQVATLSNAASTNQWSVAELDTVGRTHVNKTGHTQFRIRFATDDNNDNGSDYIAWYPGENATPENRPVLEIVYQP